MRPSAPAVHFFCTRRPRSGVDWRRARRSWRETLPRPSARLAGRAGARLGRSAPAALPAGQAQIPNEGGGVVNRVFSPRDDDTSTRSPTDDEIELATGCFFEHVSDSADIRLDPDCLRTSLIRHDHIVWIVYIFLVWNFSEGSEGFILRV